MEFTLQVEEKEFIDKKGEVVKYFVYTAEMFGCDITLKPDDECKRLANYLLRNHLGKGGN